jgi:O-antigen/teichoic acid export membrane protein
MYQDDLKLIVVLTVVEFCLSTPTMISQTLTTSNEDFSRISKYNVITGIYRYGTMVAAAFVFKKPSIVVAFMVLRRFFDIYCARKIMQWPDRAVWHPRINFQEFKAILAKSSILSLAHFFQATIMASGSILVNRIFGTFVLGNYRAAFDLSSRIWFLSNGIGLLLFPKFSKILANETDRKRIATSVYEILKTSWAVYMLISLAGIILAKYFLPLIGLDSEQVWLFFIILFVGMCMNAHSNLSYEFLLAQGRYETVTKLSFICLVLLWGTFYLLKTLGPHSIAWAWVVSQATYAILSDELLIAMNRNKDDIVQNMFFLIKLGIFAVTLVCLFAEIYYKGIISLSLIAVATLSGLFYILSNSSIKQYRKKV